MIEYTLLCLSNSSCTSVKLWTHKKCARLDQTLTLVHVLEKNGGKCMAQKYNFTCVLSALIRSEIFDHCEKHNTFLPLGLIFSQTHLQIEARAQTKLQNVSTLGAMF